MSSNGVLIYKHGELGGRNQARIWWSDRTGKEEDSGFPIGFYMGPGLGLRLSPDGSFAAGDAPLETGLPDIQLLDLSRRTLERLTLDYLRDVSPVWSSNGKQIVFSSNRSGVFNLFTIGAKGENERLLFESQADKSAQDWSADGQNILFQTAGDEGVGDIWLYSIREGKATPLVETPFNETDAQFSPDGQWFTYTSDNTIVAQRFPPDGRKWPVSPRGGNTSSMESEWKRDLLPLGGTIVVGQSLSPRYGLQSVGAGRPFFMATGSYDVARGLRKAVPNRTSGEGHQRTSDDDSQLAPVASESESVTGSPQRREPPKFDLMSRLLARIVSNGGQKSVVTVCDPSRASPANASILPAVSATPMSVRDHWPAQIHALPWRTDVVRMARQRFARPGRRECCFQQAPTCPPPYAQEIWAACFS